MAITASRVEAMIVAARERVQNNWTPPGRTLNGLIAGDVRPLTTGAADMYLDFYSWVWGRKPSEEEREQVLRRLRDVPVAAEWSLRDAVLTTCALWEQIQELSAQDQQMIREFLHREIGPGSYPELQTPRVTAAPAFEQAQRDSAGQHNAVMQALRNWPGLPG
jgi:hypothetical protein